MMVPPLKVVIDGVEAAEAAIRGARRELGQLSARYAITGGRFTLAKSGPELFEAHLEILLPQHQVIVNAAAAAPERARREALSLARGCLAALERRDPAIRSAHQAKAA